MAQISDEYYYNIILSAKIRMSESFYKSIINYLDIIRGNIFDEPKSLYYVINNPDIFICALNKYVNNNDLSDSTKEKYIQAIMMLFNYSSDMKNNNYDLYIKWSTLYNSVKCARTQINQASQDQIDSYISLDELTCIRDSLSINDQFRILLSLTLDICPLRSGDYSHLLIIYDSADMRGDINYIMIDKQNNKAEIYINVYKTAKSYNTIKLDVPSRTYCEIIENLRNEPKDYLFTNNKNQPYSNKTAFMYWANGTLKRLTNNTKITFTTLRHIYITELADNDVNNRNKLARNMGHSIQTQYKYIWTNINKK